MGEGEEVILQLIIHLVFAAGTAAVAHSKGRSTVGWFFGGLLLGCLGLIIVLCLSNLHEVEARFQNSEAQTRRVREELRQEKLKVEALRQHTAARLDLHDKELGLDTRSAGPALPSSSPRLSIPGAPKASIPPGLSQEENDSEEWFYVESDNQLGPFTRKQMRLKLANGLIGRDTLIWNQRLPDWEPASGVSEFRDLA